MIHSLRFGKSTLVVQGAQHHNIVNRAVDFASAMPDEHVQLGPVTLDGDAVRIDIAGPAKGALTSDEMHFTYDPEREAVSSLTTMLKVAGVPLHKVTLESQDRPDLADTFVSEFRDRI